MTLDTTLLDDLNDLAELGSRLGALTSLGAGFAAALRVGTIQHDDVATLIDGYASSLVVLQQRIADNMAKHVDAAAGTDKPSLATIGERRSTVTLTRTMEATRETKTTAAA